MNPSLETFGLGCVLLVTAIGVSYYYGPRRVPEIPYVRLALEIEDDKEYTEDKIGKTLGHYFVGPYGNSSLSNQEWWENKFIQYIRDYKEDEYIFDDIFDKIPIAYNDKVITIDSTTRYKSLNESCANAYKQKSLTDIVLPAGNTEIKLKNNLWKYCSDYGEGPLFIRETLGDTQTENTIGSVISGEVLSIFPEENSIFWREKNEAFRNLDTSPTIPLFAEEFQKAKDNIMSLKDICYKAYNLPINNSYNLKAKQVVRYCSLAKL